jgi:hypothetical protein
LRPARPHGIFDIGSQGILEVIDEAWLLRGTYVLTKVEGVKTFYIIPMGDRSAPTARSTFLCS